jgi:hypothetical protein
MMRLHDLEACGRDPLAIHVGELARQPTMQRAVERAEVRIGLDLVREDRFIISHLERRHGTIRAQATFGQPPDNIVTA